MADSAEELQGFDDLALLERVGQRDQVAFDVLYSRYVRPVAWMARSMLRSSQSAEDAAQATFLVLWRKAGRIKIEGCSLLPWLLGVCRIECRSMLRKDHSLDRRGMEVARERPSDGPSPEELAIESEMVHMIDLYVARMSDIDRCIYRLCLVKEVSYEDAAKELGITHGAVRNRLSRLKAGLRRHLPSQGTEAPK
ncbi:sigma-70 family RNA polymerase sigma factor [Arthrobacter sp. AL12]|uniref:RNA polymerase sigma factor n=1 Tax=Arthrobacter sp. AL12 TaxID=3042241 RepID=UPI00249A2960|nr:sigma-70 family RNA polymerase sigma factor [Arthrobacter sp. AL12]MDI3213548.1 sigma-70 family RNA polymerase sigma factor [Arthrobacter sp. AL12]